MHSLKLLRRLVPVAMMASALTACSKDKGLAPDKATAQLSGYNHTAEYIHEFYVDGAWGGNVFAYSGGGSFVCCLVYPRQWREGLSAKVRWSTTSSDPKAAGTAAESRWHELVVPIEPFKEPGTTLNVHFLEGGKVRLIVFSGSDLAPGYPGPRLPPKPKDFKLSATWNLTASKSCCGRTLWASPVPASQPLGSRSFGPCQLRRRATGGTTHLAANATVLAAPGTSPVRPGVPPRGNSRNALAPRMAACARPIASRKSTSACSLRAPTTTWCVTNRRWVTQTSSASSTHTSRTGRTTSGSTSRASAPRSPRSAKTAKTPAERSMPPAARRASTTPCCRCSTPCAVPARKWIWPRKPRCGRSSPAAAAMACPPGGGWATPRWSPSSSASTSAC
jgi:hypothetical protein